MSAQPPPSGPDTRDDDAVGGPPPLPADAVDARPWPPLPAGWWRGTQPHATFPVPFTVADGFLLFAWTVVGQFVLGLPLAGIGMLVEFPSADVAMLALVSATFTGLLATTLLYLRLRQRLTWHLWGPIRPSWSHVGWGLLAGIGGFLGIQLSIGLILTALGEDDVPQQELLQAVDGTASILLLVLGAVVLAPIVEEIVFRGVLFQALRRRLGLWPGALISSLAFGFIHVEVIGAEALPGAMIAVVLLCVALVPRLPLPVRLVLGATGLAAAAWAVTVGGLAGTLLPVGLTLLGLVFALAFHRTGGLLVPIVAHAAFNAISVGLTVLVQAFDLAPV